MDPLAVVTIGIGIWLLGSNVIVKFRSRSPFMKSKGGTKVSGQAQKRAQLHQSRTQVSFADQRTAFLE